MSTIEQKEQNLFNAMETLGQLYDEIESFLDILYSNMERAGFSTKGERLRSGTFTVRNLSRRLLATATIIYIQGTGNDEDIADEEDREGEEEEDIVKDKIDKTELDITPELCIPFVHVALFEPKTIPTSRTLESPTLCVGAIGKMSFIDKKTGDPTLPDSPVMTLSNLANISFKPTYKLGDSIRSNIWKPARMKKYKLVGKLVGFEKLRLLEIDSQEKIRQIADKLASFTRC